jgi:hypothetical protein
MEKESFLSIYFSTFPSLSFFFVSVRKMYLLMMTRKDHQKNIIQKAKRTGRPDRAMWVIVRTWYISKRAVAILQTCSAMNGLFFLNTHYYCSEIALDGYWLWN